MTGVFTTDRAALTDGQRVLLDGVEQIVDDLNPPELDRDACAATLEDGALWLSLPHRNRPEWGLSVGMPEDDEVIVDWGADHHHFYTEAGHDPLGFVRCLLRGEIETSVRESRIGQRTTSSWIRPDGTRDRFVSGYTVFLTRRPDREPRVHRPDFMT